MQRWQEWSADQQNTLGEISTCTHEASDGIVQGITPPPSARLWLVYILYSNSSKVLAFNCTIVKSHFTYEKNMSNVPINFFTLTKYRRICFWEPWLLYNMGVEILLYKCSSILNHMTKPTLIPMIMTTPSLCQSQSRCRKILPCDNRLITYRWLSARLQ